MGVDEADGAWDILPGRAIAGAPARAVATVVFEEADPRDPPSTRISSCESGDTENPPWPLDARALSRLEIQYPLSFGAIIVAIWPDVLPLLLRTVK